MLHYNNNESLQNRRIRFNSGDLIKTGLLSSSSCSVIYGSMDLRGRIIQSKYNTIKLEIIIKFSISI